MRRARMSKPSFVLDDHLSQAPKDPGATLPSAGSRLSPDSASHRLLRADRRLLQGGLPFSLPPLPTGLVSVALAPVARCANLDCQAADVPAACPRFREAPRSMQLGLSSSGC